MRTVDRQSAFGIRAIPLDAGLRTDRRPPIPWSSTQRTSVDLMGGFVRGPLHSTDTGFPKNEFGPGMNFAIQPAPIQVASSVDIGRLRQKAMLQQVGSEHRAR
jgi:hypothetical protein